MFIIFSVDGKEWIPDKQTTDGGCKGSLMFQRFEESFVMIDAENLEEHSVELHWAVNDMDYFLYETDVYSPGEFYRIVKELKRYL